MNDFYYRKLNVYHKSMELVANGSLNEVMCQLEAAQLLGYISQQQFDEQELFISETTKMLVGLRQNFEDKLV